MASLYDALKASRSQRFPDYFTLLWGRKLSAKMIKTLTGTLPLTFTAKGGTAVDWVIYGNDDNGTENILNINDTWITAGQTTYSVDGQTLTVTGNWYAYIIIPVERNTNYYLDFNTVSSTAVQAAAVLGVLNGVLNNTDVVVNRQGAPIIFTTGEREQIAVVFYSGMNTVGTSVYDNIMLVKGSTAPDHYIPYQQGVGERTANKLPAPVNGVYSANRTTVTVTDGVYHIVQTEGSGSSSVYIDLPEFEVPDSGYINYLNSMAFANAAVVLRYNGASLSGGYALTPINRAVAIGSDYTGKKINQIQIYITGDVAMDFIIAPMITDSNTYTAYIPYGYQIPLTVSQQGQPDKTVDIYIGDSPLTEGETVSKTSTGVDIELFEGENTVSTTLYNKPTMEIKYK